MFGEIKCANCKEGKIYMANSEVCDDNPSLKSYLCLCYQCDGLTEVIVDRAHFNIVEVNNWGVPTEVFEEDIEDIEGNEG